MPTPNAPRRTLTVKGKTYTVPSFRSLQRMVFDGVATTPCRCRVEPDGSCHHGLPSWLILLGYC